MNQMQNDPFIRLVGVRKEFATRGEQFLAVSDVTFDVAEGELVALETAIQQALT